MPFDLTLGRTCDHRIVDETLTLEGMTPYYYADLRFPSNKNKDEIQVREHYETEDNQHYVYLLDGITDFEMVNDGARLLFNQTDFAPGVNYVEGSTFVIPNRIYLGSYISTILDCPKCLGVKVLKDIGFNRVGLLSNVRGIERVRQNVSKVLLTVIGNNIFNPNYGSTLSSAIGEKLTPTIFFKLQQTVVNAIQGLIEIQAQEVDTLPADEIILGLNNLNINVNEQDPRLVDIVIEVLVGTFQPVATNLQLRVQ
jgi:phage baseplate assembly protein W